MFSFNSLLACIFESSHVVILHILLFSLRSKHLGDNFNLLTKLMINVFKNLIFRKKKSKMLDYKNYKVLKKMYKKYNTKRNLHFVITCYFVISLFNIYFREKCYTYCIFKWNYTNFKMHHEHFLSKIWTMWKK